MKKLAIICLLLALLAALLCGCGEQNIVYCDHCGEETAVDPQVTEDWLVYCPKCNEELFGDDPIIEPVE